LEADSDEAGSSLSDKDINSVTDRGHDKDSAAGSGSQVQIMSKPQDTWNSHGVHSFTGGASGLRLQEAPHVKRILHQLMPFSSS